jgi:hypothetical protein
VLLTSSDKSGLFFFIMTTTWKTFYAWLLIAGFFLFFLPGQAHAEEQSAETEVPEKKKIENVGYDDGLYIQDKRGRYLLRFNALLQARLSFDLPDEGDNRTRFSIPRGRIGFSGHVFSKRYRYGFLADFGLGGVALLDFFLDTVIIPKALHFWVGQGKKPFGRQFITYGGNLEMVSRAVTFLLFGARRDLGVMLHNNHDKADGLEWAVGLFNGTDARPQLVAIYNPTTGEPETIVSTNLPETWRPEVVVRLGVNGGGIKGYSEGDLEGGSLRWGIGTSWRTKFESANDGYSDTAGELDLILKVYGFAFVSGAYVLWESEEGSAGLSDLEYRRWGTYNQISYTIKAMHGFVFRWALIDPRYMNNNLHEFVWGYSLYVLDHRIKWQLDGGIARWDYYAPTDKRDVKNGFIRTQIQFAF